MPLNEASSANLSSWSFRSLYWVTRLLRTSLPLIVSVLALPSMAEVVLLAPVTWVALFPRWNWRKADGTA